MYIYVCNNLILKNIIDLSSHLLISLINIIFLILIKKLVLAKMFRKNALEHLNMRVD